jgi:glycosyltransferase involved in cell wall biosynthesis
MKLLFVHEKSGAFAGAEANILATATELKQRGHLVGLLHGPVTGKGQAEWHETFQNRFSLEANGGAAIVPRVLDMFAPDLIYVHKMADLKVLERLLASRLPIVRMVHDHDMYCMRSYKYNFFTRRICRRGASPFCIFPCGASIARSGEAWPPVKWVSYSDKLDEIRLNKQFDLLLVGSNYMKEELLRNGFEDGKIEIHPPVPPPGDPALRANFSERNIIIYAGQIIRGKGVDVLISSLSQIETPFECYIFGDGNHRSFCERLSRSLGLAAHVHFKGHVPPEEIKIYYREASMVVVSSVWPEPFGAVGLEGMRYSLPVVAFDAGAVKEWLIDGYNGYVVPWMDRATFAERIEDLLRDKMLARQMGENGRAMVAEYYGFSKYINGLEKTFSRAVQSPLRMAA